jgi:hypothetical protein
MHLGAEDATRFDRTLDGAVPVAVQIADVLDP